MNRIILPILNIFTFFIKKENIKLPDELRKQISRAKVLSFEKSVEPNPFVEPIKKGSTPKSVLNKKRKLPSISSQSNTESKNDDEGVFDIWAQEEEEPIIKEYPDDWYKPTVKKIKKAPPKEKPNEFKAVEIVEPGASYNPDPEDHKKLLEKVISESNNEEDEKLKTLDKLLKKRNKKNKDEEDISIFIDRNTVTEDVEEEPEIGNQNEGDNKKNIEYGERKTKAQRNREKRRKEHEEKMKMKQLMKQKRAELEKLDDFVKEIEEKEIIIEQQRKIKEILKQAEQYKIKKLGKLRYREELPEILTEDELPHSLRNLRANTSLLEDRFKSLQKRNLLEVRKKTRYIIISISIILIETHFSFSFNF